MRMWVNGYICTDIWIDADIMGQCKVNWQMYEHEQPSSEMSFFFFLSLVYFRVVFLQAVYV